MKLSNSYLALGEAFYQVVQPTAVAEPRTFLWNDTLAESLPLSELAFTHTADYFSGNQVFANSTPIALAYAGHQFGHYNPQLGDGRAHLLGQLKNRQGVELDIQLKGSGQTRYSRRGDGRCALGPAIREFIMSEAMYALGVPTTRTLAVVTTGEEVYRQVAEPGAVVTRVAASHLRVGTFQYVAAHYDESALSRLLDYAITRHYPHIDLVDDDKACLFLKAVIEKQIQTTVEWMRVGFIHGVMNTDNTSISGETIDYGPCAMMGDYDPLTVFSSIDSEGRYCYGNQPWIMQWNMARLAESLLPLLEVDKQQAIEKLESIIFQITDQYKEAYYAMMSRKLGLNGGCHQQLVDRLLEIMHSNRQDYTTTFQRLTDALTPNDTELHRALNAELGDWFNDWLAHIEDSTTAQSTMKQHNPIVIPRNHHVETVLAECQRSGNNQAAEQFLEVLRSPYQTLSRSYLYQDLAQDKDANYQTFCGT